MPGRHYGGKVVTLVLAGLWVLAGGASARGETIIFTNTHAEVFVTLANGSLNLSVFDEDNEVEYAANQVFFFVPSLAQTTRPAGSQFDFLGVPPGAPIWVLPQVQNPQLNYVGIGAEDLDPDDFMGDLQLQLVGFRGPAGAQYSAFQTSPFGQILLYIATSDGISPGDFVPFGAGNELHYNQVFTAPGIYELDYQAVGTLANGMVVTSPVTTYTFGVETLPAGAVPEPGTLTLLGVGCVAVVAPLLRRRTKKVAGGQRG